MYMYFWLDRMYRGKSLRATDIYNTSFFILLCLYDEGTYRPTCPISEPTGRDGRQP